MDANAVNRQGGSPQPLPGVAHLQGPAALQAQTAHRAEKGVPDIEPLYSPLTHAANQIIKRGCDILRALFGLIVTLPCWLILPMLIRLDSQGPVLYSQERVGRRPGRQRLPDHPRWDHPAAGIANETLRIYKFRTMIAEAERGTGPVWSQKHDPRVTRLGAILRATHLDEIPQFLNILMGEMLMVGPRLERPKFVKQNAASIAHDHHCCAVRPGLTGLAQVATGYDCSFDSVAEKARLDGEYIHHWSLWRDLSILLRMARVVLPRSGAH